MMNTTQKYSKPAIIMHALTGLLILVMFAIGLYMAEIPKDMPKTATLDLFDLGIYTMQFADAVTPRAFYFNLHKSIGISLLVLIFIRVYIRISRPVPAFPSTMKAWEICLSKWVHRVMYVLMVAVPVAGVIMSINSKYGIKWFGVRLIGGMDNENMREIFKGFHEILGIILIALIILHIVAAIKHKVIDKDDVMSRMSLR